ncbi:hypothetical protein GPECTOR_6g565 [Gonium pectorale]|uniref:C-type lectin domain-containing protein n=1 Tax=Gonium pectorale TaxID=33097 RepID=A0A150GVD3_GONPE|nr:hypothetical protein GPECTOR_6g565 [Gonium pectorale]|eukprot:KXZ53648.1 hypothetical protein GPECTOR_6g565 [Gonium pectorale]
MFLALLLATAFAVSISGVDGQLEQVESLDVKNAPQKTTPKPPVPQPPKKKEYSAFAYKKKWLYLVSGDRYDYASAWDFCYSKGLSLIPYNDLKLREPTYQLCYKNKRGCWVGGKQANFCAYIDPAGNGGPYARLCNEKQYVVCYGKLN